MGQRKIFITFVYSLLVKNLLCTTPTHNLKTPKYPTFNSLKHSLTIVDQQNDDQNNTDACIQSNQYLLASLTWRFLMPLGGLLTICLPWLMYACCLPIATSQRFVPGYFSLDVFCTLWYPASLSCMWARTVLASEPAGQKTPFFLEIDGTKNAFIYKLWQSCYVSESRIEQTNSIEPQIVLVRWQQRASVFGILSWSSSLENSPLLGQSFLIPTNSIWKMILDIQ